MMMKYPKEYLDEIRLRLKVSQVVGKYVQLKKRGKEFVGLSPFKNEKTPSFTVNDEKGFYHCFSTGEHGNIFDFLMKTKSFKFGEAVRSLATEAGMEIYKFSKFDKEKEARFVKYKNIYKLFKDFFHKQLFDSENFFALKYLLDRKISIETIKKFNIGYVPKKNNFLNDLKKNYSEEEIKLSGLYYLIENSNTFINRFNDRIIFPVLNLSGDPIAFGGRVIQSTKLAKYINSPETEFYKKGRQLFNLNFAKDERLNPEEVIIVEGYIDVLSLHSVGIKNVISNSGTALTENQIRLIWKFFQNPIICLDGDDSGQKAAIRIAERLFPLINENNKIFFTILNKGSDPDDIVKKGGKVAFLEVLKNKIIIQKFLWDQYIEKVNTNNPYEITKFEKQIKNLCSQILDETLKKYILEDFLNKISQLTPNVNSKKKYQFNTKQKFKVLNETKQIHLQKKNLSRINVLELSILFVMINYSSVAKIRNKEIAELIFETVENNNLKSKLVKLNSMENIDKNLMDGVLKENSSLIDKINTSVNLKIILDKKNFKQIEEILVDLINDLEEFDNKRKIESLEKKLINNMEESAYSELLRLKSQLNRE